ncbi:MAG: hypothetical protein WBA57_20395 [Elainellaceae cyanobacterium]
MKSMHKLQMKWSMVAVAFLGVGVVADLLPHPALGSSLLVWGVNTILGDRQAPVQAVDDSINANQDSQNTPSVRVGQSNSQPAESDFN